MIGLLIGLSLAGCVRATAGNNYCDIARPILFDTDAVVDQLAVSDPQLLRDVVTHNEIHDRLCK